MAGKWRVMSNSIPQIDPCLKKAQKRKGEKNSSFCGNDQLWHV